MAGIEPGSHCKYKQGQKPSQSSALVLSKARSSEELREKDSKDTGRFVGEDRNEAGQYNDGEDDEPRDPRIQRLLKESVVLQEKHTRLMAQSPLRLKQGSAERMGLTSYQQ